MNELEQWTADVCAALGLPTVESKPILDLARDVAHGVLRPAAPLTAYLAGIAVGRGAEPDVVAAQVGTLVEAWTAEHGSPAERGAGGGRN